jgi:hypothetical protein
MITFKKLINYYNWGGRFLTDPFHLRVNALNENELNKSLSRTEIINRLIQATKKENSVYLEIGVRNPADNFNHICAEKKYSVDPGIEFEANPVDFKLTSDAFFEQLKTGKIRDKNLLFDVIFIDGLHTAEQVYKDILNSLDFIQPNGFIVLHDCNPPSEWHARETYAYEISPAMNYWNGTTWKGYVKALEIAGISGCCVDSDWGVGILSKSMDFGQPEKIANPFYEFTVFDADRKQQLNLISIDRFEELFPKKK